MNRLPPDQVIADDLAGHRAKLFDPVDGRWAWFWRNRKANRHLRQLSQTTPALITRYKTGQQAFRTALDQVQKEPRRQVRRLRWQLVSAGIGAVFRRFGWSILTFTALAVIAALIWFNLPYLASLLDPPAVPYFPEPFGEGPR